MLSVCTLLARDVTAWQAWRDAEPLALNGAAWLRLPATEAAARRQAVQYLQAHADVFIATPTGCCSLYLWSGLAPPSTHMPTFWEVQLTVEQQHALIARLESAARPHLVVDRRQSPVQFRDAPLHRYLEQRFGRRVVAGDFEVWISANALTPSQSPSFAQH